MSGQDPVAWLRAQIEARHELALVITAPRPHLRGSGAGLAAEWRTGCTCEAECPGYPACEEVTGDGIHIYSEGGHDADQAAHIAANDPLDTIARCESELAILDEHAMIGPNSRSGPICNRCVNIAVDPSDADAFYVPYPCRTVALVASGYRHRPGYEATWKP